MALFTAPPNKKQTNKPKVGLPAKTAKLLSLFLIFKIENNNEHSFGFPEFCFPTNQEKDWYDNKSLVYCYNTPDLISVCVGGGCCFGLWFKRFQSMADLICCLWACRSPRLKHVVEQSSPSYDSWEAKRETRKNQDLKIHFLVHPQCSDFFLEVPTF